MLVAVLTLACGGDTKSAPPAGTPAKVAEPAKPAEPTRSAPAPEAAKPPVAAAAPGAVAGSCMNKAASQCTEYLDASLDAAAAKGMCDLIDGTFTAATACPPAKKLGSCALPAAMRKSLTFYPGGEDELTAALAQEECKSMSGTWAS